MHSVSRRHFIKMSSGSLAAIALTGSPFLDKGKPLKLSFSTLGCPNWTWGKILDFAFKHGYAGIEIRGLLGEMNLVKCPEFNSRERVRASLKRAEDKGVSIMGLGSSAVLHNADEQAWNKDLESAKQFIDLSDTLNCPFVRVFPNKIPQNENRDATIERIGKRLLLLGEYANGSKVTVLMESHGDALEVPVIKQILELADHPHVGLLWDVFNMWSVTKVPPSEVYPQLKKYIRHTHLKDGIFRDGQYHYVLFGRGECPVYEAVDILENERYRGFYGFEWEKVWHPSKNLRWQYRIMPRK